MSFHLRDYPVGLDLESDTDTVDKHVGLGHKFLLHREVVHKQM
jgi:hypothetical protein